nr:MmoB/DmpM family protein [Haloechinothrix alba]
MCGVTLQNSQTGSVIAQVMDAKPNVQAEYLPSMIRIDGRKRFEFNYDEIAEALGEDEFDASDLEEVISTHYGRMVRTDDSTIMVAHPEDAAEELGFDLKPVK